MGTAFIAAPLEPLISALTLLQSRHWGVQAMSPPQAAGLGRSRPTGVKQEGALLYAAPLPRR